MTQLSLLNLFTLKDLLPIHHLNMEMRDGWAGSSDESQRGSSQFKSPHGAVIERRLQGHTETADAQTGERPSKGESNPGAGSASSVPN